MRWLGLVVISLAAFDAPASDGGRATEAAAEAVDSDALAQAARCLDRGDEAGAVPHLESIVRAHPDQVMFRAQLAELLFRLDRFGAARGHFERFVADAQEATGPPRRHLVHCHTRLMEIARRDDDRAGELLHRGVGLLLVAGGGEGERAGTDGGFGEGVLCRAAKALAEARELSPRDPRVLLYLGEAYARLGNRRAACRAWEAARAADVPGALTPVERGRLTAPERARDDAGRGRP